MMALSVRFSLTQVTVWATQWAQQAPGKTHHCPKEGVRGKIWASHVNRSLRGNAKNTHCGWQRWSIGFSVDIWLAPLSFSPARSLLLRCLESPCPCFYVHGLRLRFPMLSWGCFAVGVGCAVVGGLAGCRRSRGSSGTGASASCTWNWWAELAFRRSAYLHSNTHPLKHDFGIDDVIHSSVNCMPAR